MGESVTYEGWLDVMYVVACLYDKREALERLRIDCPYYPYTAKLMTSAGIPERFHGKHVRITVEVLEE